MYSLFIIAIMFVGIHFSYRYLEHRVAFVPNVLESQSKERYSQMMGKLETEKGLEKQKGAPSEDEIKRKEELNSFLDELKQSPSNESNASTIPKT